LTKTLEFVGLIVNFEFQLKTKRFKSTKKTAFCSFNSCRNETVSECFYIQSFIKQSKLLTVSGERGDHCLSTIRAEKLFLS